MVVSVELVKGVVMGSGCSFVECPAGKAPGGCFDFNERTIKPRSGAFDKCAVLEIKNSALVLAFLFQDIKDIKRENSFSNSNRADRSRPQQRAGSDLNQ